ncbi:YDG/SRA domain-containing protein [Blastococcus sp. SYSU DS0828]
MVYPVRVIRRARRKSPPHFPVTGYCYDGLYIVVQHWVAPSELDGPLVFRFVLEESDGGTR